MIYLSEDKIIEFTLTDSVTGLAFNLTGVAGILIKLYQNAGNVIEQYSYITTAGYKPIVLVGLATAGKVSLQLLAEKSKLLNDKPLFAEAKIKLPNVAFTSGFQDFICKSEIDLMADSILKYSTVPT